MKLIKYGVLLFLSIILMPASAQTIGRKTISSAGRYVINSSLQVGYNIGEAVIFIGSNSDAVVTQGFEQEDKFLLSSVNASASVMHFAAYPNPVSDILYISVQTKNKFPYKLTMFDAIGKTVKDISVEGYFDGQAVMKLNISELPAGIYMLSLHNVEHRLYMHFKITKI